MPRRLALLLLLATAAPAAVQAQLPLFVDGLAGGAFNTDENTPTGNGGGFAWLGQAGVNFPRVSFGGEFATYKTGAGAKSRVYGGFVRFPSYIGRSSTQLYLTLGLGAYQFSPSGGESSTTVGGSVGPGVRVRLRGSPLAVLAEVRFHSTFDKLPRINNQQYLAAMGGLELDF